MKKSRAKRALVWISGADRIKSAVAILKGRASFPVARNAISRIKKNYAAKPIYEISDADLRRSISGHAIMIVALLPIALYSLFCVARGVSALVQFGSITTWLLYGTPMLIFAGSQILTSFISRKTFLAKIQ